MTIYIKKIVASSAVAMSLIGGAAFAQEAYSDWNTDGTAGINQEEFNSGVGNTGLYDKWDADSDGTLSETEFQDGLYGYYDADDNGTIEEPEFGDLGDDMGDGGLFDV
ncbi:MAG: hypothetical protein VYD57_13950 [Pseudomonadota bacterium]|nr:hypothetical protein [Pseudomonadota bacterium]